MPDEIAKPTTKGCGRGNEAQAGNAACFSRIRFNAFTPKRHACGSQSDTLAAGENNL
jgi:hypothetical protein